jgi:hypothetical protein
VLAQGLSIGPTSGTHCGFIQDIKRSAITLCQVAEPAATDLKATLLIKARTDRREVPVRTLGITARLEGVWHKAGQQRLKRAM